MVSVSFIESDVRAAFPTSNVLRGERYVRQGRVTDVVISNAGSTIAANVRGSRATPYSVTAYATRRRGAATRLTGYCTCPIGEDCKHVAAAFFSALEQTTGKLPFSAPSELVADSRLVTWLDELREIATPSASGAAHSDARIAYVFRSEADNGSRGLPIDISVGETVESLADSKAPNVTAEDRMIGILARLYQTSQSGRGTLADDLVRRLVATDAAFFDSVEANAHALVLGEERRARVEWTLGGDGLQRPTLAFDDTNVRALAPGLAWYVDTAQNVAGPVDAGIPRTLLHTLLDGPPIPANQAARVRQALAVDAPGLALPVPNDVSQREERIAPVPVLLLRGVTGRELFAERPDDIAEFSFAYGDATASPARFDRELRTTVGGETVVYVRDRMAETIAAKRLTIAGLEAEPTARGTSPATQIYRYGSLVEWQWSLFVHEIVPQLRADGWRVTIDPSFGRRVVDLTASEMWHPSVREAGSGWFDLALGIEIDGKRYDLLPMLADIIAQSDADPASQTYYVAIDGGATTLALPHARVRAILDTLVELHEPGASSEGALHLPDSRAAVIAELEASAELRWDAPERIRTLSERLRSFTGLERVDVPPGFAGTLRPYQREGLDWLAFLAEYGFDGILADDMGLGKSVQTLAHLLREKAAGRLQRPALLVVPTSLVFNWCDEAKRFAPSLRVLALHGPNRAARFSDIEEHDLVITTYALLVRDRALFERSWAIGILDEAQAIKNAQSKVAQAALELKATQRLCLTGTPVENNLGDLWSLFSFAMPGALGDRKHFNRIYRVPIEKRGDAARGRALAERIRPFLLRRTKEAVATDLPEKSEIVQRVELTGAQRDLYETVRLAMSRRVRDEIEERGIARSQIVILDALLKLRQVCCDPRLLPPDLRKAAESVKLEMLLEMLPQAIAEGRRVLLFSQFTSMLALIAPALETLGIGFVTLTGETKDRADVVARFQTGDVPVFLISLKAGGTGLNLTAADTVIHYDPWWNPAVERQATDRAHRIGQTKPVFVFKLVCAGTVEEKIVDLQTRKAELAAALFSDDAAGSMSLGREDIERLFAPIGES